FSYTNIHSQFQRRTGEPARAGCGAFVRAAHYRRDWLQRRRFHAAHDRAIFSCLCAVHSAPRFICLAAGIANGGTRARHIQRYNRRGHSGALAAPDRWSPRNQMKEFAPQLAQVSSAERLITTLFFAVLLHGIVILGVRFTGEEASSQTGSTLEVTLVNTSRNELPDDADYLANASQKGAGNTEERARPQSAMSSPDEFALDGAPE